MRETILDTIFNAYDDAFKILKEDPDFIFENERDRLKLIYASQKKFRNWKKNKNCIYQGCKKKSIQNSHSIQKSSSIKFISENNHVLTPEFSTKLGRVGMKKEGINEASTFPGFCEEHERLFDEFENQMELKNEGHFILQIYRTICREIVKSELSLEVMKNNLSNYLHFRDTKIEDLVIKQVSKELLIENNIKLKGIKLKGIDYRQNKIEKNISILENYQKSLAELNQAILNDAKKGKFQKIACHSIEIDTQIPICIAGRGNFHIRPKIKTKNVEAIFNVLPYKNKTYVTICTLKKYTKELELYMEHSKHPLRLISLIESWMVYGSDHWFIRPSLWDKLENKTKEHVLENILNLDKNIGCEYEFSILNELRKELVGLMDEEISTLDSNHIELLELERKKIRE